MTNRNLAKSLLFNTCLLGAVSLQPAAQGHHQDGIVADSLSKEDFSFGC